MMNKFAENAYVQLLTEGDILYINYKPESNIDHEAAQQFLDLTSELCNNKPYLVLLDMSNLKWIDKAARDLIAAHPITNQMIGWAFHSKIPLHKIMYTIFITCSKSKATMEFFNGPEEGLVWLREIQRMRLKDIIE